MNDTFRSMRLQGVSKDQIRILSVFHQEDPVIKRYDLVNESPFINKVIKTSMMESFQQI